MNETFNNCPKCHCTHFVKAGLGNGKQRYKCKGCNHYFSVKQRSNQKSNDIKKQAIDMYLEGLGFHSIGRGLTSVMVQSINGLNNLASNIKLDKIPIKR